MQRDDTIFTEVSGVNFSNFLRDSIRNLARITDAEPRIATKMQQQSKATEEPAPDRCTPFQAAIIDRGFNRDRDPCPVCSSRLLPRRPSNIGNESPVKLLAITKPESKLNAREQELFNIAMMYAVWKSGLVAIEDAVLTKTNTSTRTQ